MKSSVQIGLTGLILGLFAVLGTGLVALTEWHTAPLIAENERAALLAELDSVLPPAQRDNDLFGSAVEIPDPHGLLHGEAPVTAYQARRGGVVTGVAYPVTAPDGYNGRIRLLVGIDPEGELLGVRVLQHSETPGLGDSIEPGKSDWILGFTGRSLGDPPPAKWAVAKDGGVFDQFTGATITPRAVVKAVKNALLYFRAHREALLAGPSKSEQAEP